MRCKFLRICMWMILCFFMDISHLEASEDLNRFCKESFEMVRLHRFMPISAEQKFERNARFKSNSILEELMNGIPIELNDGNLGELSGSKVLLRAFWFGDFSLEHSTEEVAEMIAKFARFIRKVYSNSERLQLKDRDLDQITWEDISFHQHQAWVFIEDGAGEILSAIRVYYFDYEDHYARYGRMDNDLQLFLPMERRDLMIRGNRSLHSSLFVAPKNFFVEHSDLRRKLLENMEIRSSSPEKEKKPLVELRIPPRNLSKSEVFNAKKIHQSFQIAELTRYIRIKHRFNRSPVVFQSMSKALSFILKSRNISLARMEAATEKHHRFFSTFLDEVDPMKLSDYSRELHYFFETTPEKLERVSK